MERVLSGVERVFVEFASQVLRKAFLVFLRCREWIDLYEQFSRILKVRFDSYVCPFDSFHRDNLHIALLSGFLGGVARRDRDNGCYRLVGGRDAYLFPGSDLAESSPSSCCPQKFAKRAACS